MPNAILGQGLAMVDNVMKGGTALDSQKWSNFSGGNAGELVVFPAA
jgi:hypothetical protein